MATWYSAIDGAAQARLRAAWKGAPIENEELLGFLVDTARLQVVEFAPEATTAEAAIAEVLLRFGLTDRLEEVLALLDLVEGEPAFNLVYAQLQQIKNLWAAGRADEQGDIGSEGFSFVPRPLDKTVRSIIRPTNAEVSGGF
ncbi:hypothetical protein [Microbacterium sp. Leaf320]|uniref:hypothetical protein n=1 Tax=Microbacterium sp. Leaf320 TaxID=1736334 RepID=UPI0006FE77D0|nr:hypothetical protein [Microbacterium sp. Leaf320]KQQ65193.1 hypothetical protein ASF63_14645 [Microbacterium sp. Leaf320]